MFFDNLVGKKIMSELGNAPEDNRENSMTQDQGMIRAYFSRLKVAKAERKEAQKASDLLSGWLDCLKVDPRVTSFHTVKSGTTETVIAFSPPDERLNPSRGNSIRRITTNERMMSRNDDGDPVHAVHIRDYFIDLDNQELVEQSCFHTYEEDPLEGLLDNAPPLILDTENGYELSESHQYIWPDLTQTERDPVMYPKSRIEAFQAFTGSTLDIARLLSQVPAAEVYTWQ
jgi:hypothetical protein